MTCSPALYHGLCEDSAYSEILKLTLPKTVFAPNPTAPLGLPTINLLRVKATGTQDFPFQSVDCEVISSAMTWAIYLAMIPCPNLFGWQQSSW